MPPPPQPLQRPQTSSASFLARYGLPVCLWLWVFYVYWFGSFRPPAAPSFAYRHDIRQQNDNDNDVEPTTTPTEFAAATLVSTTTPTDASSSQDASHLPPFVGDPLVPSYDRPVCLDTLSSCPDVDQWMTPQAIIAGTQKGGTRALLHYLSDHPAAYRWQGTEAKIFNNAARMNDEFNDTTVDPCHVRRVYQDLFVSKQGPHYNATTLARQPYMFDKSPSYMWHAEIVPQRVVCVFPAGVKLILLLRHPVDRSYSHYHHNDEKYGVPTESFRDKIQTEISLLRQWGLDESAASAELQAAFWKRYKEHAPKGMSLVARSLYVLQLRQWLAVLHDAYGPDLSDTLLILPSERLHTHTQGTLDDILDFLHMAPYTYPVTAEHHVHSYDALSEHTRQYLDDFYRPWNLQLRDLLLPYGVTLPWAE